MLNTSEGLTETLYDDIDSLENVSSLAVDYKGYVFWSTSRDGKTKGSIFKARVDEPNDDTIQIVS